MTETIIVSKDSSAFKTIVRLIETGKINKNSWLIVSEGVKQKMKAEGSSEVYAWRNINFKYRKVMILRYNIRRFTSFDEVEFSETAEPDDIIIMKEE